MKLGKIFNKKTVYIGLFAVLYVSVALVSTIHAFSFFGLANARDLAVMLACTFEIGQAAVLFSILTSEHDRKRVMPWVLMSILTLVQILGNVFSSYRYLMQHSSHDLRFFKEPIFVWTDLPDQMTTVILTYIVGAILPVVALCLTAMVSNYLSDQAHDKEAAKKEPEIKKEPVTIHKAEAEPEPEAEQEVKADEPEAEAEPEVKKEPVTEPEVTADEPESETKKELVAEQEVKTDEPESETKKEPVAEQEVNADEPEHESEAEAEPEAEKDKKPVMKSHFINL
jgi:flagellar biosynthesis GTPase FlhF